MRLTQSLNDPHQSIAVRVEFNLAHSAIMRGFYAHREP